MTPLPKLDGQTFGQLTVRSFAGYAEDSDGWRESRWLCRCTCGAYRTVATRRLRTARGVRACRACAEARRVELRRRRRAA